MFVEDHVRHFFGSRHLSISSWVPRSPYSLSWISTHREVLCLYGESPPPPPPVPPHHNPLSKTTPYTYSFDCFCMSSPSLVPIRYHRSYPHPYVPYSPWLTLPPLGRRLMDPRFDKETHGPERLLKTHVSFGPDVPVRLYSRHTDLRVIMFYKWTTT